LVRTKDVFLLRSQLRLVIPATKTVSPYNEDLCLAGWELISHTRVTSPGRVFIVFYGFLAGSNCIFGFYLFAGVTPPDLPILVWHVKGRCGDFFTGLPVRRAMKKYNPTLTAAREISWNRFDEHTCSSGLPENHLYDLRAAQIH